MTRRIGMVGSALTGACVLCFAICMLVGCDFGSYSVCMLLSLGYVMMACAFSHASNSTAGTVGTIFAGVYCTIILLVYFAQTTAVRLDGLNAQALQILDYSQSGLFFDYDLLGYGMMALSTFFIGLTVRSDTWLKWLLMIHGVFFFTCLIFPMLGLFSSGDALMGTIALECWCLYFLPICILSFLYFKRMDTAGA